LIQVVCIGTLPGLAQSERPLADAATTFVGGIGASIITVGALVSVTGTLNTIMLAGPRLLYVMADEGLFPRFLSITHQRFHTPYVSILVTAVVVLVLTVFSSFMSALTLSTI